MELQHPGEHGGEVCPSGPRIEPAPTAVAGFVGTFPTGPTGRPTTVQSAAEFMLVFGAVGETTDTTIGVLDFFANGGSSAVIVAADDSSGQRCVDGLVHGVTLLQPSAGQAPPIQLLCIPDMARRGADPLSQKQYEELLLRVTDLCVQHRIFLIVDPNVAGDEVADIERWLQMNPLWGSANSALYFPRLHTPAGVAAAAAPVASSGAVAGVMARIDGHRGVWKAPAGQDAVVAAVVATSMTDRQQSPLNRHGINVIRRFEDLGTVIWGARTGAGAIGAEFRNVPVRRTALFLEHSLTIGLQWAASEPNSEPLWVRITSSVADFLRRLWRLGAFVGATSAEAFFVRCDHTTMTRVDLRRGRTVIHLGFAPLKPAEFVILQVILERR